MNDKSVVLLYGLPCSGKSMVVKSLPDHAAIAVDEIITKVITEPEIEDFQRLAGEIAEEMVAIIDGMDDEHIVVEMGCLMPQRVIWRVEQYMHDNGIRFTNILLTADDAELIERIRQRNADIEAGISDSIKVDGPDYLTRFKLILENNMPESFVELDTSALSREQVMMRVIAEIN